MVIAFLLILDGLLKFPKLAARTLSWYDELFKFCRRLASSLSAVSLDRNVLAAFFHKFGGESGIDDGLCV